MTSELSHASDGFGVVDPVDDPSQVTVTRVTEVVEVIDTIEVVETVGPDGTIERDVVAVEHAEHDVIDVESVVVESADVRQHDFAADEERVATQGALPLDVRTGDAGVDAAVAQLRDLDDRPVADHAEVFTAVHRALQDALVDLDRS